MEHCTMTLKKAKTLAFILAGLFLFAALRAVPVEGTRDVPGAGKIYKAAQTAAPAVAAKQKKDRGDHAAAWEQRTAAPCLPGAGVPAVMREEMRSAVSVAPLSNKDPPIPT